METASLGAIVASGLVGGVDDPVVVVLNVGSVVVIRGIHVVVALV